MVKINLRDSFPEYGMDCYIDVFENDVEAFVAAVTEAEAAIFFQFARMEAAYNRRLFRNKAHYSLDVGDGIESIAISLPSDPAVIYENKSATERLYSAVKHLPNKQAKRIYAHYILGMAKSDIACFEGVDEKAVRVAILRGLLKLEIFLRD